MFIEGINLDVDVVDIAANVVLQVVRRRAEL